MLFVTNRVLKEGPTPVNEDGSYSLPRPVHFALENNQAEQSVYFCRRKGLDDYEEIGNRAFFSELKSSPAKQIFLFIHGYSCLPEPAIFPSTVVLQDLFNRRTNGEVLVVPLVWPCDNDLGAVKDYFDDQIAADASDIAYARMFQKFLSWREENNNLIDPCAKPINLLAHSMGNRVLRGAIARTIQYFQPQGFPLIFRNIFMAAADVSNDTLNFKQPGEYIANSSRNVAVYFAGDDLAMRASKIANVSITARRLGHTGPAQMAEVPRNVFAIDCGDFNNLYDDPVGHGYFMTDPAGNPGLLFDHMVECIQRGRVPMEPGTARIMILRSRFWQR